MWKHKQCHEPLRTYRVANLLLASSLLASPAIFAEPSVNGNIISWPEDGWYQVQTADGADTLCNGGNSCTVEPGRYLVINHSLGIRYTDVQVDDVGGPNEVVVTGQTISWPDFGWYQVQSVDGLDTYCNGGRTCEVEPGVYTVINHTTGQRFDTIVVKADPAVSPVTVNGQRISWPEDGWYQVQSGDGSSTICSGGSYCDVPLGTYLVINHTTGVRFTGIRVSDGVSTVINRDNHIELLDQVFSVYTGAIHGNRLPGVADEFMEAHLSTPVDVPEDISINNDYAVLFDYACDNGGVLEYMKTSGFPYKIEELNWVDCLDGDALKNGLVYSQDNNGYYGYYRYLLHSPSYSADYSNGERMEISGSYGSIQESHLDPSFINLKRWTTEEFSYRLKKESSLLEVSDATTEVRHYWRRRLGNEFLGSLYGSFRLNSDLTDHQDMDVMTSEALFISASVDYGSPYPDEWNFTGGTLELSADDGSALRLEADNGDVNTADISLLQDGAVLETFQQPWSLWQDVLTQIQSDPRDRQ